MVVGDGETPRTGALLCYRSQWRVLAVDPCLDAGRVKGSVARLECRAAKIQEEVIEVDAACEHVRRAESS